MKESLPIDGLYLTRYERALHISSDERLAVVSSAVVGGDLEFTQHVVNMYVHKDYDCSNPAADLYALASDLEIVEPFVGMMTGTRLDRVQVVVEQDEQLKVIAIVTAGLSNPTAAGVEMPIQIVTPGTINIILIIDARLPRAARVNAIITATEAKTLALVKADIRAKHGGLASGTSTDSIVIATTERGARFEYAGPITPVGALIGRAVRCTILNAVRA